MPGLSIAKKGILLILGLVLLESAFVAALAYRLKIADDDARNEARVKEMYIHTQSVARGLYTAHEKIWTWHKSLTPETEKDLRDTLARVQSEIDFLQKNVQTTEQKTKISELDAAARPLIQRILGWIDRINKAPELEKQLLIIESSEDIRLPKAEVQQLAINFMKVQQQKLHSTPQAQDAFRRNMQIVVLVGLAANILFAIALAVFFARDIISKLNIILWNTGRLGSNQELSAPLKGGDEIVALDASFHEMARQLKEYERLRQAYIAMFRNELASPLNQVLKNIETLKAEPASAISAQGQKMLGTAERNLKRLVGIIDDLTESNSLQPAQMTLSPSVVSLADLSERSLDSVRTFAEDRGIKLASKSEDAVFVADGDRLVQVLVNLLSNAVKFSPKGETVTLEAYKHKEDGSIRLNVVDRGRGVPEKNRLTIFEKFQQVESADGKQGSGTGLGLNICKQIIEMHGGKIGVDSIEGQGSTFWILLPEKTLQSSEKGAR